jgi:citrate synthase
MRRLIVTMTGIFGFLGPQKAYVSQEEGEPVVHGLARALGLALDSFQLQALNAALVLIADHEFNPATFAARIAASGDADLHACISAALAVHFGSQIGLRCDEMERLLASPADAAAIMAKVEATLSAGRTLPGFNHPLYPQGDPRAAMLIDLARQAGRSEAAAGTLEVIEEMRRRFDVLPTIETGLFVLCRVLGLPEQAASGLFALARSAGWAAHIIEQHVANFMIRPRAMFMPPA